MLDLEDPHERGGCCLARSSSGRNGLDPPALSALRTVSSPHTGAGHAVVTTVIKVLPPQKQQWAGEGQALPVKERHRQLLGARSVTKNDKITHSQDCWGITWAQGV